MALHGQRVILAQGTSDDETSQRFSVSRGNPMLVGIYPQANLGSDTAELQIIDPTGVGLTATDDNGEIILSGDGTGTANGQPRRTEVVIGAGEWQIYVATRTGSWGIWVQPY